MATQPETSLGLSVPTSKPLHRDARLVTCPSRSQCPEPPDSTSSPDRPRAPATQCLTEHQMGMGVNEAFSGTVGRTLGPQERRGGQLVPGVGQSTSARYHSILVIIL